MDWGSQKGKEKNNFWNYIKFYIHSSQQTLVEVGSKNSPKILGETAILLGRKQFQLMWVGTFIINGHAHQLTKKLDLEQILENLTR